MRYSTLAPLAGALSVLGAGWSGAALAADPVALQLGGQYDLYAVAADQDDDFRRAGGAAGNQYNSVDVIGDNEIWLFGGTTLDSGLTVDVTVELEAGHESEGDPVDDSFLTIGSVYGTLFLGHLDNAAYLMHYGAPAVVPNFGTDADDQTSVVAAPSENAAAGYATAFINIDDDALKATYISPELFGLTLGASFVPGTDRADFSGGTDTDNRYGRDEAIEGAWAVGAQYNRFVSGAAIGLSFGYLNALSENAAGTAAAPVAAEAHEEFAAGISLSHFVWSVGGSYHVISNPDNFDIGDGTLDGYVWDAGISYEFGPFSASLSYLEASTRGQGTDDLTGPAPGTRLFDALSDEDELRHVTLGGVYALGPGVDLFGALTYVDYTDELSGLSKGELIAAGNAVTDPGGLENAGYAAVFGISLSF